jgi:hypothetical protein
VVLGVRIYDLASRWQGWCFTVNEQWRLELARRPAERPSHRWDEDHQPLLGIGADSEGSFDQADRHDGLLVVQRLLDEGSDSSKECGRPVVPDRA